VLLTSSLAPTAHLSIAASYAGAAGFQPSTTQAAVLVRTVGTGVAVRCSHSSVPAGAVVHCTATVRTEFGTAPAAPAHTASEVTVTSRADRVTYDHGNACRWVVSGHTLTCGFSITVSKGSTVHVYYRGSAKAHDASSKGTVAIKATRAS
jgi:hypothetical protein